MQQMKRFSPQQPFPFEKGLMPQEEMLEVGKQTKQLVIGIPKENNNTESRIPLTPEAVEMLVNQGHQIVIQREAGSFAH